MRVISLASFFSVPLFLIFKHKMPERWCTKAPCPIGHQWDELRPPLHHSCLPTALHHFYKEYHPWVSPTILLQVIPKSLGARTCTFFSISVLLPCSITHYPAWICAVPQAREEDLPPPSMSPLPGSDGSPVSCVWSCPRKLYPKTLVKRAKYLLDTPLLTSREWLQGWAEYTGRGKI